VATNATNDLINGKVMIKNSFAELRRVPKRPLSKKKQLATDSIVLFDAIVLLGTAGVNQTKKP